MRRLATAFAGLLMAALPGLCPAAWPADPVKIGEINSYGAIPAFTVPYRNGWQLALDEINRNGGVLGGRKLEVVSRDDGGRTADAVAAAAQLTEKDGAVILVGSYLSQIGLALSDFARQHKVLFLAAQPMTDDLVWAKGNRYTFRLRASSYMQAAMLAEQAAKLPAKRWVTVAPDYEFGRSVVANFESLLRKKRPDVTFIYDYWQPLGGLDADATVKAIERMKPEAIFNATFGSDLGKLIRESGPHGLFSHRSVVSVLTGEPEILDVLADDAPEGWIVTGYPWYDIHDAEHQKFVDAYVAAYDEDPRLAALIGYEAMKAVAAALDKAGGTDTEKLVAAFEDLTVPSPVGPISFRRDDHQATLGGWVGKTALRDGAGTMVDWTYADGARYLPPPEEVRKLRPRE